MARIRNVDRTGWRPGCYIANTEIGTLQVIEPGSVDDGWTLLVHNMRADQVRSLLTLADVTIAKACIRMPD